MTLKEAILQSLEEIGDLANHTTVYRHIARYGLYDFGDAKTPKATISAQLGEFIRRDDSRVRRIKQKNGAYSYYLTKNENRIAPSRLSSEPENGSKTGKDGIDYKERALHMLLSTYLKNQNICSKTIFHEKSSHRENDHQKWTHPDMVGVQLLELRTRTSQSLLKAIDRSNLFTLYSYELKREIGSDSDLKRDFFQTFSNSGWANYGYLVAFEINDSLREEMFRLNEAFGIGIIRLHSNPFQSQILFPAKYRELEFRTIDKLCSYNPDFDRFIAQVEKLVTAEERYYEASRKELEEFCDAYLTNDTQIEEYCRKSRIPLNDTPDEEAGT